MNIILQSDQNGLSVSVGSPKQSKRKKGKSLLLFPAQYCVIDIETTGLSTNFDEIIELAAIRISDGQIIDTFQSLVKPTYEIDEFIEQLTGITNSMLSSAPSIEDVLPNFLDFLGDDILVGHNINFDINFIYDYTFEQLNYAFSNDFVDTLRLSRKLFPNLPHHRLQDLTAYLHIKNPQAAHRALSDCYSTFAVFKSLKENSVLRYGSVDDFLKTISSKKIYNYHNVKVSELKPIKTEFDETHPLFGKLCVFTGELKFSRKQAMQTVLDCGGKIGDNLTKDTNFLIVGNFENSLNIKKGQKSGKMKKAEAYRLKGCDIQILDENTFYDMITDFSDNYLEVSKNE